jgi:uncharacterized protein YraI
MVAAFVLTACGSSAEPPVPTREPAPTFTPTTEGQAAAVDPAVAAAAATAAAQPPASADQATPEPAAQQPATTEETAAEQPAEQAAPTPTAVQAAEVVINSNMNVRGGPGTNYNILGAATQGQRFPVTGKNNDGSWWQINYNGQDGWVFGQLVTPQNTQSVAVAPNIPAPPPTATPAPIPPTNTPAPVVEQPPATQPPADQPPADQPPAEQPTAAPAPSGNYEFNRAVLQRCDPNAGVTYINGTVYKNGSPVNGYNVAFSYAPDGPIVASITSGPHAGYEGWNQGFYSHILNPTGPREGNWSVWIVDGNGQRISAIGSVHTDGEAGDGKCQQAIIDFDS